MPQGHEIIRDDHPYDDGYWLRWDGHPRPKAWTTTYDGRGNSRTVMTELQTFQGWDDCENDLRFEEAQRRAA